MRTECPGQIIRGTQDSDGLPVYSALYLSAEHLLRFYGVALSRC